MAVAANEINIEQAASHLPPAPRHVAALPRDLLYYVATPYTHYPDGIWTAYKEAAKYAGRLVAQGLAIFCPIAHQHPLAIYACLDPLDWEMWMRADAPFCAACQALIVVKMAGWQESKGVAAEIEIFKRAGKPIWFLDPRTMEVTP